MKKILLLLFVFSVRFICNSQTVSIVNKKFVVNGNVSCPIYFNGANTPWDNWNDFGGTYDAAFWAEHFALLKSNGINASRVWISCNGDVQPNISTDGTVTGVSTQFYANLDDFFKSAEANGIYIMATMMSFDHTKNTYRKYQSWRNMLNDPTKVKTYIDNYLVPFVNRYKTNPYLMSIDISNEIEWVAEDNTNMQCSYAVLQRFVGMCASAIHNNPRVDGSTVLVTLGSAATKWNATKMRNGANGTGWQDNPDGNKWSDAALKAQYNQPNAVLDYYSPHYYGWIDQYYANPYIKSTTDFGIDDKAVLIGETPAGNPGTPDMAVLASYEALKKNGYQGHFPWTSNGVDVNGGIEKFGAAALTFSKTYSSLIYPNCPEPCKTLAPVVTGSVKYCLNDKAIPLTATGTGLIWYADNTTTTALNGAPTPLTTTAGSIDYYVSQTIDRCEGPRAKITVSVYARPAAVITPATTTTFCAGGSVALNATTGTGFTYGWNDANGVIAGATTSSYAATAGGSYTVTVTSNGCSTTSDAVVVTVNPAPTATITTTTPTSFCIGGNVVLTGSTGRAYSYVWNNAQGAITGETNATYTASASGSYTLTVTSSGCSKTSSPTVVTVNPLPAATITANGPTAICEGSNVILTTTGGGSYKWFNGSTQVGTSAASYTAAAAGSYTVEVTSTNNCKSTSAPTTVTVNPLPTATITTSGATTFCTGGNVTLTTSGGTSYKWFNGSTQVGTTAASYIAAVSGSYTVEVTNANNCKGTSAPTVVTVNPLPTAVITTSGSTTFCAGGNVVLTTSGGVSYKWFNGATEVGTAVSYTASVPGSYTVEVTNANTCKATSAPTVITISAGPTWYEDKDGDGAGDLAVTKVACTQPAGYVPNAGDLCPADGNKTAPGDCGCGNLETDTDSDGDANCIDTDDDNDGIPDTNDCVPLDGTIKGGPTWYEDKDGDGAGDLAVTKVACTQPTGYVPNAGDLCPADGNKTAPGDCGCGNLETDADSDGDANCIDTDDDNDGIPDTNDCAPLDGTIKEGPTWYEDKDGDNAGDLGVTKVACTQPTGYVPNAGDLCPLDANKTSPGACGCGIAEGACNLDCAGVVNGNASLDVCNICSGGTTGIIPKLNTQECIATSIQNSLSTSLQIYPNPYESDIHIQVAEGEFTVVVYNTAGLEVMRGTYTKEANIGANLAQGIYMMRIEQDGVTETRKVIKK